MTEKLSRFANFLSWSTPKSKSGVKNLQGYFGSQKTFGEHKFEFGNGRGCDGGDQDGL